ncbi:MAG: hypothetical protein PHU93_04570 [Candidatus Gracilibacteria bacterium]|nr:hypothetical protein [Candidatus Gracilibacteria bacterium]
MKNIFGRGILIGIALIGLFSSNVHANFSGTTQEIIKSNPTLSEKISEIGILLNHQNFSSAVTQSDSLGETTSEEEILALSREDFLAFINIYNIADKTIEVDKLIEKRWELYPSERNLCSLSVLYYGYTQTCIGYSSEAAFIDKVSYVFHLIITDAQPKNEIEKYIRRLVPLANTPQDKSDLGNLIGFYVNKYPDKKNLNILTRKLGKEIVKKDPAWVNGYLLKQSGYQKNSRIRIQIIKDLEKNYKGDVERLKKVLDILKK